MTSLGSGALLCGFEAAAWARESAETDGELAGRVEFVNEGPAEMDKPFGEELDGRLYTALDDLDDENLVTPEDRFYVRTRASRLLPEAEGWAIAVDGLIGDSSGAKAQVADSGDVAARAATPGAPSKSTAGNRGQVIPIGELRIREKALGLHLMECAGNTRSAQFGMISVGDWAGVPIAEMLLDWKPSPRATRVLVSGFDEYAASSVTSVAGASWIFTFEELKSAGAFLATKLNSKPLSRDHGAPVRLVVPGWYGCTCIKWVDRITFVDESAEATSQMTEYAARTHQNGSPRFAKNFLPAKIEHAAMPIRVEKLRVNGKLKYRVTGLLWGGNGTVSKLGIRFNPEEEYVPVESLRVPQTTPWTLWSHTWAPSARGRYTIRLAILEPSVHPRRLEAGYYARSVEIEEV